MTIMHRDVRRTLEQELSAWNVEYTFGAGAKHPYVEIYKPDGQGVKLSLTTGRSGASRECLNCRAHVRRELKKLGAVPYFKNKETLADRIEPTDPLPEPPQPIKVAPKPQEPKPVAPPATPAIQREARILSTDHRPAAPPPVKHDGRGKYDRSKVVRYTQLHVARITTVLMSYGKLDLQTGIFAYNSNWSDKGVADFLRQQSDFDFITEEKVREIRRNGVGWMAGEKEEAAKFNNLGMAYVHKTLAELGRKVEELTQRVLELETKPK